MAMRWLQGQAATVNVWKGLPMYSSCSVQGHPAGCTVVVRWRTSLIEAVGQYVAGSWALCTATSCLL